jgi:cysteinyl-tRNA synthetase
VALSEWQAALGCVNRILDNKLTPPLAKDVKRRSLEKLAADLKHAGSMLGLLESAPETWLNEHRARRIAARGLDQAHISNLLGEREAARKQRDFARSDALRDELLKMGVEVMDTPSGARWRVCD